MSAERREMRSEARNDTATFCHPALDAGPREIQRRSASLKKKVIFDWFPDPVRDDGRASIDAERRAKQRRSASLKINVIFDWFPDPVRDDGRTPRDAKRSTR